MNRIDVYTAVHKMQRARLFELTVEAGRADPADTVGMARLAAAVDALAGELVAHGEHEDRFIHPVLRERDPALAAELEVAHAELDARLEQLRQVASDRGRATADPNALYRALAAFTATYLAHLAVEEERALPVLWDGCSDEELLGIIVAFRGSRTDAENLTSVLAQLATLSPPELARMASSGLGPVPLADIAELLAILLSPAQLGALRHSMAVTGSGH